MIVNCSYNGSAFEELTLFCRLDGNITFPLNSSRSAPPPFECVTISVSLDTPKRTWSITVVLQGCSQVSLQIGKKRSTGSYDLSKPVNLTVLKSKELQLQVV